MALEVLEPLQEDDTLAGVGEPGTGALSSVEEAYLAGEVRDAVEKLTRRLVKKILGRPTSRVVQGMESEDPAMPTPDHLRSVFGLDEEEGQNS